MFSLILRALGFFMRIILSRVLGAEALGTYQIAQSFFYVLVTVVASGLPSTISHMSARYKVTKDKDAEGRAVSSSLIIGITISIVLEIILLCCKNLIINATTKETFTIILCLSPSILITAIYGSFRGALWGKQKHIQNCLSEIGEQLTRLVLFFVLLYSAPTPMIGAIRAGLSYTISCLVSMFVSIIFYFKSGSVLRKPGKDFKKVLKSSLPITLLHLVSSVVQPIIAIIVPYQLQCAGYSESQAVGLFGIITGMTLPLLTLPDTLIGSYSTALIPEISASMVKDNKRELENQIKSAITFTLFICFCFVPVYLSVGKEIGQFLFNNTTSGYLLAKASLVMIPMGLNSISQNILNSLNMEFKSFKNYVIGSALMFLSIIFLPRYMGVNAMIIGMGGSIALSCMLNLLMIEKYLGIKWLVVKPLGLMLLFAIPSSMIGSFLSGLLKFAMPQFFEIAISALAALTCFVLLCMIFNVVNISTIFVSLKRFKRTKIMKKRQKNVV